MPNLYSISVERFVFAFKICFNPHNYFFKRATTFEDFLKISTIYSSFSFLPQSSYMSRLAIKPSLLILFLLVSISYSNTWKLNKHHIFLTLSPSFGCIDPLYRKSWLCFICPFSQNFFLWKIFYNSSISLNLVLYKSNSIRIASFTKLFQRTPLKHFSKYFIYFAVMRLYVCPT